MCLAKQAQEAPSHHHSGLFQTELMSSLVGIYCLSCKIVTPPPPSIFSFLSTRSIISHPEQRPRWAGQRLPQPQGTFFLSDTTSPFKICVFSWCPPPSPWHKQGFVSASRSPHLICAPLVSVARSRCAVARGQNKRVAAWLLCWPRKLAQYGCAADSAEKPLPSFVSASGWQWAAMWRFFLGAQVQTASSPSWRTAALVLWAELRKHTRESKEVRSRGRNGSLITSPASCHPSRSSWKFLGCKHVIL